MLETDGGLIDEEDSKLSPVNRSGDSAPMASDPGHRASESRELGSSHVGLAEQVMHAGLDPVTPTSAPRTHLLDTRDLMHDVVA
jgi:hypothetical protein